MLRIFLQTFSCVRATLFTFIYVFIYFFFSSSRVSRKQTWKVEKRHPILERDTLDIQLLNWAGTKTSWKVVIISHSNVHHICNIAFYLSLSALAITRGKGRGGSECL